jgi:hypothetical protein
MGLDPATWFADHCVGGHDCTSDGKCAEPKLDCVHPPKCPIGVSEAPYRSGIDSGWDDQAGSAAVDWSTRGAMNAGLAVFLYLDSVAKGIVPVQPAFDHCEQLKP